MAFRPPVRPGLQGDIRTQIPYFTQFGQDKTPHPILVALARAMYEGSGAKDVVSISQALGHNQGQVQPGYLPFQGGVRLGGKYAPRTPGLRAETLRTREPLVNFEGKPDWVSVTPSYRAYNLRNEKDEIVASAERQSYPAGRQQSGEAFVPSMWVREDYRKTPAMMDLVNILSRGGKTPLRGTIANPRLRKIFEKRMARQTGSEKPPVNPVASATRRGLVEPTQWGRPPLPKNPELTPPRRRLSPLELARAFAHDNPPPQRRQPTVAELLADVEAQTAAIVARRRPSLRRRDSER
jgi:hypothetical protein